MNDPQLIIEDVVRIILRHAQPERIWLFGSHATGEASKTSDIDIAFLDMNATPGTLEAIKDDISQLRTLTKIDVVNIAHAETRFRNRVQAQGRVLYSASLRLRAQDGLHNFSKALEKLAYIVESKDQFIKDGYADVVLDLSVKRFEFTFEMAWKAIKRYLEFAGLKCSNPRSCFMEAHAQGILQDEEPWLSMIDMRNLTSHVYDEEQVQGLLTVLPAFLLGFQSLARELAARLSDPADTGTPA